MTDKTYMTAAEAAAYLGFTVNSLYNKCSQRIIPHYKPNGGRLFFKREELDRWIAAGRVATEAEVQQKAENMKIFTKHN